MSLGKTFLECFIEQLQNLLDFCPGFNGPLGMNSPNSILSSNKISLVWKKFSTKHPWVKGIKFVQMKGHTLFQNWYKRNSEIQLWHLKLSSPELMGQNHPNFAQNDLGGRKLKFVQLKCHVAFHWKIISM